MGETSMNYVGISVIIIFGNQDFAIFFIDSGGGDVLGAQHGVRCSDVLVVGLQCYG